MLLEIIDVDKLRRGILYTVIMLITLMVQEMVLSRLSLFAVRALIVPIFPVVVGILQGGWWGMAFGLVSGVLCDCMFAETRVLFTLLMPFLGFMATAAERFLISRKLVAVFTASVCALLFTAAIEIMRMMVLYEASFAALIKTGLLQTLYSIPFIFALYFPCRALSRRSLD